jgi:membrane protease YdiL (CAAX protease family)
VPLPPPPGYPAPAYPRQGAPGGPPPYPAPYGTGYQPAYGPPPPGYPANPYAGPGPAGPGPAAEPLEFHQILRGGREGWWWPLIGLPAAAVAFLVAQVAITVPFLAVAVARGDSLGDARGALADFSDPTASSMAFLLLNLAVLIPIVLLVLRVVHGLKPGWASSVRSRLRWGFFGVCLGLAFLALLASTAVSLLIQGSGDTTGGGSLVEFDSKTRDLALILLLLTPLQAAGEEYGFRGYLTQVFGSVFAVLGPRGSRIVAVLAPATLFALAHGAQSIPVFFDRFAFGVVAGVLVIVTGGLEAGIAMHVLNNYLAFGVALAYGTLAESLQPTGGSWWQIPVTLTQSLVYLGLAWWVARRMGLATRTDPAVLAASRGLVYRGPSAPPAAPAQ